MTIAEKIKAGVDLLESFRTDFQFDETDPGYLGFINVGEDLLIHQENKDTWRFIVNNPDIFHSVIDAMGMELEGDRLDLEESIFHKSNY